MNGQLDIRGVHQALTDDGTLATVLHVILLRSWGDTIYQLDPLELYNRLEETYGGRITDDNESKIQAMITVNATDLFYTDPEAFRGIANTLAEGDPGFLMADPPILAEILWAVYEIELNREPIEFSPAVRRYIDEASNGEADETILENPDQSAYNHVFAFLEENRNRLIDQLHNIGIADFELPPVRPNQIAETIAGEANKT